MALTASAFITWLRSKVGKGYVYGAYGQIITIDFLKQMDRMYGQVMGAGYFQRLGDYTKGRCARWLNKNAYDCSGLIKAGRKDLTGVWQDFSAQGTYDSCANKGALPAILTPGNAVFMYQKDKGRIVHTGVYIGNGQVVEARGVDYGVVITQLANRSWTHWGALKWLTYDLSDKQKVDLSGHVTDVDSGDGSIPKIDDPVVVTPKPVVYEQTILDAMSDGAVISPNYWVEVVKGNIDASPENIRKLISNYHAIVHKLKG